MIDDMGQVMPPISVADELTDVETPYGKIPKWKARAIGIGWFQRVVDTVRNDAALATKTPMRDEDKPPPPVADIHGGQAATASRKDQEPPTATVSPAVVAALEAKVADLEARLARYEADMWSEQALLDLEAEIEAAHPSDDAAGLTMH
jgi:hypothetical protein